MTINEAFTTPLRKTTAKVLHELRAPEAKEHAIVTLPIENIISKGEQILNDITDMSHRMSTFEPEHWRLDGSFVLPVLPEQSIYEVGFWSKYQSNTNGMFVAPIEFLFEFAVSQDLPAVGISFDRPTNNFAQDITVTFIGMNGTVLRTETTSTNNSTYYETSGGAENVHFVRICINRTNRPQRFLRVAEVNFGVLLEFNGEDIVSIKQISEGDPTGETFPYNELRLTILNKRRFRLKDPNSLAQYFQERQPFEYSHGVVVSGIGEIYEGIEWVYCGIYYLSNWSITDEVVNFTARSRASIWGEQSFEGRALERQTIGHLIQNVVDGLGLVANIPQFLMESPLVPGWLDALNYRGAISMLAQLSCCLAVENRLKTIVFRDIIEEDVATKDITYDMAFMDTPPKITIDDYYNGITLVEYTVTQAGDDPRFERVEVFHNAPWRDPREADFPYRVNLPMMIRGEGFEEIRDWFLARKFELLRKRMRVVTNWRQNPILEVAERTNTQIDNSGELENMLSYSHTLNFDNGVLRGTTKLIGIIPDAPQHI